MIAYVATPFTSLEGLLAKNTDVDPFNAPKKLQEQIKAHYLVITRAA
jgi:hypothetical protein